MDDNTIDLGNPIHLDRLAELLSSSIIRAVRQACQRYRCDVNANEFDDLSQQVLFLLMEDNCRRIYSFENRASFGTWLKVVVSNHVCSHLRRRKRTENLDEISLESLVYQATQEEEVVAMERKELLYEALGDLTAQEQLLYQCCFIYELNSDEIAAIFQTEVKNIYKRKQTLILKLKRVVQQKQYGK